MLNGFLRALRSPRIPSDQSGKPHAMIALQHRVPKHVSTSFNYIYIYIKYGIMAWKVSKHVKAMYLD